MLLFGQIGREISGTAFAHEMKYLAQYEKVNTINVNAVVKLANPLNAELQLSCWVAIGGALRR